MKSLERKENPMVGEKGAGEGIFYFRELEGKMELKEYFALRYKEYPDAGMHVTTVRDGLDIDPFDFHSRFIGACLLEKGVERLIGGGRMIYMDSPGPSARTIREICEESLDLRELPESGRPYLFQLMNVMDLDWLVKECREEGKTLVEFGRIVVDSNYRHFGVGLDLVNALHDMANHEGIDVGFGHCPEKLQSFYERNGCRSLGKFYHSVHGFSFALLRIDFPGKLVTQS